MLPFSLDDLTERSQAKVPSLYSDVLADKAITQVELARAEASLGGARSFVYETSEEMWQTVNAGRPPSARQLALGRIAATQAVKSAASVTRTRQYARWREFDLLHVVSPQRHARDAEAITHHFTVTPHTWEEAGRVLLGRKPNVPFF